MGKNPQQLRRQRELITNRAETARLPPITHGAASIPATVATAEYQRQQAGNVSDKIRVVAPCLLLYSRRDRHKALKSAFGKRSGVVDWGVLNATKGVGRHPCQKIHERRMLGKAQRT